MNTSQKDFSQNYTNLHKQMAVNFSKQYLKHSINKNSPLLPFKSREPERVIFENGFYRILGEFARLELNKEWDDTVDINKISSEYDKTQISVGEESYTQETFEKLMKEYLFNENGELKILNPYLFLYIPLSNNKRRKGQEDIALFMRDVFCKDNQNLVEFFENKNTYHNFIKLILTTVPELPDKETKVKFINILPKIVDLFNEDINYAIDHDDFLTENIDKIFAYYYFFYVSQLILKINRGFDDDIELDDLYFLLDWESANKNRKTIKKGYSFLKDMGKSLFTQMTLIDQLNTLMGGKGLLKKELYECFTQLSEQNQYEFIYYLKKWICDYKYLRKFDDGNKLPEDYMDELDDDFKNLVDVLFESLNDVKYGVNQEVNSRYALNLEEIGKKYFLKRRGSKGYVLNITREMLLVITTLCVKDKKIKLNQLFEEYEKRGLFFDIHSQREIITFLTKLNIIDKKSDSGDAQYVKPVLSQKLE